MNKFKNDSGTYYTRGLFFETTLADKSTVVYTLKNQDHEGFPSLYRLYMEAADPTEYRFATSALDGWSHWEALCACSWFKPYLTSWRRELEIKIKSDALLEVLAIAKTGGKEKLAANRFLIEKGWEPQKSGKGRPSKDEVNRAAFEIASERAQLDDDFDRITKAN